MGGNLHCDPAGWTIAWPLSRQKSSEKVAAKIEEKGLVKGRKVSRMLYASAVEVTPDKQGRIQPPAKLREYAGPRPRCTIIGSRSFAEIWNTEAWNANQETSDEDFTAAMEDLDLLTKQDDNTWNFHISPYCCSPA